MLLRLLRLPRRRFQVFHVARQGPVRHYPPKDCQQSHYVPILDRTNQRVHSRYAPEALRRAEVAELQQVRHVRARRVQALMVVRVGQTVVYQEKPEALHESGRWGFQAIQDAVLRAHRAREWAVA